MVVYVTVCLAILVTMSIALYRAAAGPSLFDRILAVNTVGTKTVLLICVIDLMIERPDFLDLALLYSLMNFIGMVAVLRFSKYGHFDETAVDSAPEATP